MRIGISGLAVANGGGLGRLNRACILALAVTRPEWELHVYLRDPRHSELIAADADQPGHRRLEPVVYHFPAVPANRVLLENLSLPGRFSRLGLDAYLGCDFTLPLKRVAAREAVVVPDLLPFTQPGTVSLRARLLYRSGLRRAIARHARLLCISEHTAARLCDTFPATPMSRYVIHPAISPKMSECAAKVSIIDHSLQVQGTRGSLIDPGRFLLYVGDFGPRKNVHILVNAYRRLRDSGRYHGSLVLAGGDGRFGDGPREPVLAFQSLSQVPADDSNRHSIYDLGRVSDFDLSSLYSQADLLISLSSEEGFGYPVLEALIHGTPCLVTAGSAMAAVAPGGILETEPNADAVAECVSTNLEGLAALRTEIRRLPESFGSIEQLGEDLADSLEGQ